MTPLRIDFSSIPDLEPIPAGVYPAVVADIELRESKTTSNPYLNWTFEITAPEYLGRRVWLVTGLSPEALWKLRETLEALGEQDLSGEIDFDPQDYIGETCRVVVSQEVYNGRTRNRVDSVLPPVQEQLIR